MDAVAAVASAPAVALAAVRATSNLSIPSSACLGCPRLPRLPQPEPRQSQVFEKIRILLLKAVCLGSLSIQKSFPLKKIIDHFDRNFSVFFHTVFFHHYQPRHLGKTQKTLGISIL